MTTTKKQQTVYQFFQPLKLRAVAPPTRPDNDNDNDEDEDDFEVSLASLIQQQKQTKKTKRPRPPESQRRKRAEKKPKSLARAATLKLNQTLLVSSSSLRKKQETIMATTTREVHCRGTRNRNRNGIIASKPQQESVLEEQENNNNRQEGTKRRARHSNPNEQQTAEPPTKEGDVSKKKPNNEDDEDVKKKPPNGNEPYSHQTRPKRIYSTSAVDVLPDDDTDINTKPSSSNVLSHLVRRTTHGGRNVRRFTPPPMKWKSPSWVTLEYNATTTTVKHICWDAMGVLVAIASSDNFIRIYDWDMIRAADRLGRSDRARLLSKSEYKMPPILQFRVPHPVTSLLWNPYHLDQLAVGFRHSGQVHLYNVDRVSNWLSRTNNKNIHNHNPRRQQLPPPSTFRSISYPHSSGSVVGCHFLNSETLVVNLGTVVYCWKQSLTSTTSTSTTSTTKNPSPFQLAWRYKPPSAVTSMAPLSSTSSSSTTTTTTSDLLLLGTHEGQLCLLNWNQSTTERAFSSERRPVVLHEWTPHRSSLSTSTTTSQNKMLHLQGAACSHPHYATTSWSCIDISWVTAGGWLLSTRLENSTATTSSTKSKSTSTKSIRGSTTKTSADTVLHAPPLVDLRNADGSRILPANNSNQKKAYSVPMDPVLVDHHPCSSSWYWSEVPKSTKILPHHDKYVSSAPQPPIRSESSSSSKSSSRAVLCCKKDGTRRTVHRMKLPASTAAPCAMAVHPDGQWMVLGVDHRLVVLKVGRA